jgi:hypothetical protein
MQQFITNEQRPTAPIAVWRQIFALLGGPIIWFVHLVLSYPLVPHVCATGWTWLLHAITLVTFAVALATSWVGRQDYRVLRDIEDADRSTRRSRFVALYGIWSGIFWAVVILAEGLPVLVIDPCSWNVSSL